eukprot:SAG31_NODE_21068_length_558_cov_1.257081_1_plen_45_part_01
MLTRAAKRRRQTTADAAACVSCSFAETKETFVEQRFYECLTCDMT